MAHFSLGTVYGQDISLSQCLTLCRVALTGPAIHPGRGGGGTMLLAASCYGKKGPFNA